MPRDWQSFTNPAHQLSTSFLYVFLLCCVSYSLENYYQSRRNGYVKLEIYWEETEQEFERQILAADCLIGGSLSVPSCIMHNPVANTSLTQEGRCRMVGFVAKRIYRTGCVLAVLLISSFDITAERLPIKTYTTADGLAHNEVNRIVCDSRGFLWFCTREGLSRFDGYGFTTYGLEDGLPSAIINDLLVTREGAYWVATAGGLCRFNPVPRAQSRNNGAADGNHAADLMFKRCSTDQDAESKYVLSLLQDRAGVVWCGTRNGLYQVEAASDEVKLASVDIGIPARFESRFIQCLFEDHLGSRSE